MVDKNVDQDVRLAEALTDDDGAYRATFTIADRRRGKHRPNLQTRAFAGETFLCASGVRYNASNRKSLFLNVFLNEKASATPVRQPKLSA